MKEVFLFGGSFNPFHLSHEKIADFAASFGKEVWILPIYSPWKGQDFLDIDSRIEVLELKYKDHPLIKISHAGRNTVYMADILDNLSKDFPDYKFTLVMGADTFESIGKWRRYAEFKDKVKYLVIPRQGTDGTVREDVGDYSSTEIRKNWQTLKNDLDPIVREYIEKKLFS